MYDLRHEAETSDSDSTLPLPLIVDRSDDTRASRAQLHAVTLSTTTEASVRRSNSILILRSDSARTTSENAIAALKGATLA